MKYSDCIAEWLVQLGYTHCFYVGGGNIMYLLSSLSKRLDCRAVINEIAAGIAAEYFNETSSCAKALALVTAGPGLTNIVTAFAGAYLESRELLVIGGQVKTSDLSLGELRQRGIQEIDGVAIVKSISVYSVSCKKPMLCEAFTKAVLASSSARKGPVFLEIPLDIQAQEVAFESVKKELITISTLPTFQEKDLLTLIELIKKSKRPIFLIGGGVTRNTVNEIASYLEILGIPVATTWNGADRIDANHPCYVGRPNTWGQRSANLILQQADLLVAFGTRLGMQQTGFNWQNFLPRGQIVQIDIDPSELNKGHPVVHLPICADANDLIKRLVQQDLGEYKNWMQYSHLIRQLIPCVEPINKTGNSFISPYVFVDILSKICQSNDIIIPCSSGGAFTVMMQTFQQKLGQKMVTNKGLASMGYGLSGAIGAAFANPKNRVVLIEGDGGFSQNLQEIGTAAINKLNLKIFIFDDAGYASIRMTQKNYFGGNYVGCDRDTGLGLPNWDKLFAAWDVPVFRVNKNFENELVFCELFEGDGIAAFIVSIDPEQTYFPKIASQINSFGVIESDPLHLMTPPLDEEINKQVSIYI